jgi:hypothetical protein
MELDVLTASPTMSTNMGSQCATQTRTTWLQNRRESSGRIVLIGMERLLCRWCILTAANSLDRTNFVQDIISRATLEQYILLVRREWIHSNSLWTHHRELWAENGDALSRIYAGTGALNTSFTRSGKRTLAGTLYYLCVDFCLTSASPARPCI